MNADSKLFYYAQFSLNALQKFKKSFVNDLYNSYICGNSYKENRPEFYDVIVYNLTESEEKKLEKFEENLDLESLDNQIQIKAKELSILLEKKEEQLKEQYVKFSNIK